MQSLTSEQSRKHLRNEHMFMVEVRWSERVSSARDMVSLPHACQALSICIA